MSEIHVKAGDRAYLQEADTFADVTRDHILGLKKGCVVMSDDGKLMAFCGGNSSTVVEKTSGKDGDGNSVSVPTDVKTIGPAVLARFGVDEVDQVTLFDKFIVLDSTVRNEKAAFWENHQYDDDILAVFIPEVLQILESDDLYIAKHADSLLSHVSAEVRATMLANMATRTDTDTRKGLIVRFTLIQNDRVQVEEFRQAMFALLLDNAAYTRIEMTRCLRTIEGMPESEADETITNFLATASDQTIAEFVQKWRSMKYYTRSARECGTRKVLHVLKKNDIENPQLDSVTDHGSA